MNTSNIQSNDVEYADPYGENEGGLAYSNSIDHGSAPESGEQSPTSARDDLRTRGMSPVEHAVNGTYFIERE